MGMSRNPANNERVAGWSLQSDRSTSAQAMSELWGADLRPLLPQHLHPQTMRKKRLKQKHRRQSR